MGEIDDVDEIVDPLAGLRGAEDDEDDLLASADKLAEEDQPVSPSYGGATGGFAGGGGGAGGSGDGGSGDVGGSTLFERMANLSRASGSDDEDEDSDDPDSDEADGDDEDVSADSHHSATFRPSEQQHTHNRV